MDEVILQPYEQYENYYKNKHEEALQEYWENLVEKSEIDIQENKKMVSKYKKLLSNISDFGKKIAGLRFLRTIVIILGIIDTLLLVLYIVNDPQWLAILICTLVLGGCIVAIVFLCKGINNAEYEKMRLQSEADDTKRMCYRIMSPLNELYSWKMTSEIINKTIPIVKLNEFFDHEKMYLFHKEGYTFNYKQSNQSVIMIHSGTIAGNPLVFLRRIYMSKKTKKYHGERKIEWVTRIINSDGSYKDEKTYEILRASVMKEVPYYTFDDEILYLNETTPHLSFSRNVSGLKGKTEREINKHVEKEVKTIEKKVQRAIDKGEKYVAMSNYEFEALFGAHNRNNEIEFRMLFTPLAQQNLISLIKSQYPYGDDFIIEKRQKISKIVNEHSKHFDYDTNPIRYIDYVYEDAKKRFFEFNRRFFESFYFDIAPLLSIPEYQQRNSRYDKTDDAGYKQISICEYEYIANLFICNVEEDLYKFNKKINKIELVAKYKDFDHLQIYTNRFEEVERVDYIKVLARDGVRYEVPVPWIEYIPTVDTTNVVIGLFNLSSEEISELKYKRVYNDFVNNFVTDENIQFIKGMIVYETSPELTIESMRCLKRIINKK